MVFQYPEHQLFAETVYEDVAFGPRNMGLPEDEVDTRIREALADVHLDFDTLSKRSPFELSGGQQRRVAFAGVLAMRPTTLVLDEPVAGLDPASRTDFLDLIKQLHEQRNLTVVMVSHNMNDIALLADRMLVMHEGEVAFLGHTEEIFTKHAVELREIGLGIPHAQTLANQLRAEGMPLPEKLYLPESLADEIARVLGGSEAVPIMNIDAVFGRYIAKDSAVHRMDPRAKLLLSILFMVMVFAAGSYVSLGVAALFTAGMFAFAHISLRQAFTSIAPLAILVVFTGAAEHFLRSGRRSVPSAMDHLH